MVWAVSNKKINGQEFSKPLTLAPAAATTYDLESSTYKNLYTNRLLIDGTTHVATVLLPKVAENKGATLKIYQKAGINYGVIKHQAAEQSGATVVTLSAAQLCAELYCDGSTWAVVSLSSTNVNS